MNEQHLISNLIEDKKLEALISEAYTIRGVHDDTASWINVVQDPNHELVARVKAKLEKSLQDLLDHAKKQKTQQEREVLQRCYSVISSICKVKYLAYDEAVSLGFVACDLKTLSDQDKDEESTELKKEVCWICNGTGRDFDGPCPKCEYEHEA